MKWFQDNVVTLVVGVLVVGLAALVWFRGAVAPAPDAEALEGKIDGLGTTLSGKFDSLAGEIRKDREAKAKSAADPAKEPAKAGTQKLADPEEVKEGIGKAAADAYKAGLEKTGVKILTREDILKMADEAVSALTKAN